MKTLWPKLLPALLIALFLLAPAALMEEAVETAEPVDAVLDEQTVDIVEDDTLGGDEVYTYSADTYDAAPSDALYAASGEVAVNATNFPDETLRNYLLGAGDTDRNGSLSAAEIANIKELKCNPNDFTGIKYLTSVESITTGPNTVTLDVSGLTHLKSINFSYDALTTLNTSGCTGLTELSLYNATQLTSLNVSGCTGLTNLDTSHGLNSTGVLTTLNVSGCTNLESLFCSYNQLTSLDVSGCTSLTKLFCYNNQLTSASFNFSGCPNITELNCINNQLTYLDVTGLTNLKNLYCSYNQLTSASLNFSGLTNLEALTCDNNQLTSLNLSGCSKIFWLLCNNNQLTSLNLSGCSSISEMRCQDNQLTSLDLSSCKELNRFDCSNNKLKKLDVSKCPNMVKLAVKKYKKTADAGKEYYWSNKEDLDDASLLFDSGVTLITTTGKSSSSSSSSTKTKVANKKLKVTAYVGTPVQMETGGETGKSFKSSNKKVATVNSKGVVTPKAAGKAKITYKTSSANYTVTLTVKDLTIPKWVVLNMKGTVAAKVGDKVTLTPTMNEGAVSKFKWTTSDKKIATVKGGVVTFKKKGTVTITVTTVKGSKKAKVKFKVSK